MIHSVEQVAVGAAAVPFNFCGFGGIAAVGEGAAMGALRGGGGSYGRNWSRLAGGMKEGAGFFGHIGAVCG